MYKWKEPIVEGIRFIGDNYEEVHRFLGIKETGYTCYGQHVRAVNFKDWHGCTKTVVVGEYILKIFGEFFVYSKEQMDKMFVSVEMSSKS